MVSDSTRFKIFTNTSKQAQTKKQSTDYNQIQNTINKALLGMAKIRVIDPIVRFKFGKYNPRLLDKGKARFLANSLDASGIRCFVPENMLPLLVPSADHVVLDGLIKDISATQNVTELELTKVGRERAYLTFASGQHRIEAVKIYVKGLEDELRALQKKIAANKNPSDRSGDIAKEEEIKEKIEKATFWGILVYDESKCIII
jgi:hypothetical protein